MSENGWTDDFLCTEWFRDTFIPAAKARNTSGQPILLIYDGHGSHTTAEMRKLAEENNIELFCLPPHTTHRTQPLDVGVFGPLQTRWQERCDAVLQETGQEIRRTAFIKEYMVARSQAFLSETIKKAWAKCGICPLNRNVFTDEDLAPSASTSIKGPLPTSYPSKFFSWQAHGGDSDSDHDADNSDENDNDNYNNDDSDDNEEINYDDNNNINNTTENVNNTHTPVQSEHSSRHTASFAIRIAPPAPTPTLPPVSLVLAKRQRSGLEAENADLRRQLEAMQKEKEAAWVHATMARVQVEELSAKLNSKTKNQEELPLMHVPEVRWLMGNKGREHWRVEEVMIQAKKQKKADVVARKEQAEAEKQQRRREMMLGTREIVFLGGLSSKKVEDLRDIAYALAISEEGTKEVLVASIKSNLETQPELQQNPRFAGLFSSRSQQRPAPMNENIPPQPQGPIADPSSHSAILNQAGQSHLHPAAASHTFGPTQSFGTYHYSSYITNYTPDTTHNIPIPPLQPSPLAPVNSTTIPPLHFYHSNPS